MTRGLLTYWHKHPGVRSGTDLNLGEWVPKGNPVLDPREGPDGSVSEESRGKLDEQYFEPCRCFPFPCCQNPTALRNVRQVRS